MVLTLGGFFFTMERQFKKKLNSSKIYEVYLCKKKKKNRGGKLTPLIFLTYPECDQLAVVSHQLLCLPLLQIQKSLVFFLHSKITAVSGFMISNCWRN